MNTDHYNSSHSRPIDAMASYMPLSFSALILTEVFKATINMYLQSILQEYNIDLTRVEIKQ